MGVDGSVATPAFVFNVLAAVPREIAEKLGRRVSLPSVAIARVLPSVEESVAAMSFLLLGEGFFSCPIVLCEPVDWPTTTEWLPIEGDGPGTAPAAVTICGGAELGAGSACMAW
jgi:hypothetical protein